MTVEFTDAEAKAAIELFNIAVQARGLAAAQAALTLTEKIASASNAESAIIPDVLVKDDQEQTE